MDLEVIAKGLRTNWPAASEDTIARHVAAIVAKDRRTCFDCLAEYAMSQYNHEPTLQEELEAETNPDVVLRRHGITAATHPAAKRDMARQLLRRRSMIVKRGAPLPVAQATPTVTRRRDPRSPRPRGRRQRHVSRSTSSGDSGDSGSSEGGGEPPPPALLRRLGLTFRKVRWCRRCRRFAYAIDDYQRDQLDQLGFRDVCPDCQRKAGS